jgi:subtilisin family serine protease
VIAYKALGEGGGYTSDLVAAIDQAVADGVDVINYSIGGGAATVAADTLAFLFAADAGVYSAVSAGNSGPGAKTIGGPADVPWVTSVGANTQPTFYQGTIEAGGKRYLGASVTKGVGPAKFVDAAAAGSELCLEGQLQPGRSPAIVPASAAATGAWPKRRGAAGRWGGHGPVQCGRCRHPLQRRSSLPTVISTSPPAPGAGCRAMAGNTPKPSGNSQPSGELFQAIAGTSMSSPVVAGSYALLKQAHPTWSPAAAKSALMTTANTAVRDNDRVSAAGPFAMGSGMVDLGEPRSRGSAYQPGLVYDAGFTDYLGFLCARVRQCAGTRRRRVRRWPRAVSPPGRPT